MRNHQADDATGLEIAIVGMAGRFPGAPDVETFWSNVRDGVESVVRYSDDALRARGVSADLLADPDYVKAGVPFDGADLFDAGFFGYTPRDADQLDPQHRIFLECAWAALEHAGRDPQRHPGRVGVYAGSGASVYLMRQLLPHHRLEDGGNIADLLGLMSGNMPDALCTRVAYKLNLRGPAVTVQTACSTSLMAVHTACQGLLGHECDMALAGGVSLNLLQNGGYRHQAGAIFSPDGHCRAFDARAGGTLQGSGAGIVVLKRLDDALRDGDTIHAVIKGSAANNDGSDKVGFTAPSVSGQAAVIRAAQAMAGVSADSIGCVEAHGTGTTLGDPIEIAALTQAFRSSTERKGYCAIGSVKTNVGHLDAAAGVAGLIKAVLALKHRTLPPSLHFEKPNPQIDFESSPFYVNTAAKSWAAADVPRRAGVSAFGIGGTNVHVVLEEAPASDQTVEGSVWQILPLSARNAVALEQMGRSLATHLQQAQPRPALADVAQTLQLGRRAFEHRRAVVANSPEMAVEILSSEAAPHRRSSEAPAQNPEVGFLFPGGGVQHANMGLALYKNEPVFKEEVDRCCELLRAELGADLRQLLYPAPGGEATADEALARMDHAQPALFVMGYAMAKLWMARGVRPSLMLGHSLGEYVAACLAGVFRLEDAVRIVAARGRLLHSLPRGAMTAVPFAEHELEPFLRCGCDLGAINGERLCVLSGSLAAIEAAEQILRDREITPRRLHIAVASHSAMTEPVLGELERVISSVPRQTPGLAFISSVTGKPITAEQATSPAYWAQHLRCAVRFADGLREMFRSPGRAVLEVGPGEALTGLVRQHPLSASAAGIWPSQAHPQQQARNEQQMVQAIAGLWCAGVDIDWAVCHPGRRSRRVPLPTYSFQRQSYWIQAPGQAAGAQARGSAIDALAGARGPFYVPSWQRATPRGEGAVGDGAGAPATALVFGGESGIAQPVMDQLRARGTTVVRVEPGEAYDRSAQGHYVVRPGERADYELMLREVEGGLGPVGAVYHLWSVGAVAQRSMQGDAVLELGFHSVLALVQALEAGARNDAAKCVLMVAANGSEDITGQELLCAEKATLFPLCKVISQECPQIDARFIDVAAPESDAACGALARQFIDESRLPRANDTPIAYRGPNRWVKTYEPLQLQPEGAPRLRRQGVYLITGGLGGVGLALAQHLAQYWQARLVLVGRTAVPDRSGWEALAAAEDQPQAICQKLHKLLALETAGAEVLTVTADVADVVQMRAVVAQARERFGGIHGVLHAAGSADDGMLGTRTREAVERVFAPKLRGTQVLLDILGKANLDFMFFCSSISSMTGGLGKGDYAAANAYLDAAAAVAARRLAYPVISVDWDAWRGLGMAAGMKIPDGIGWDGPEGAQVFERIVNGPALSQVVTSTTDLQTRLGDIDNGMLEVIGSYIPATGIRRAHPRPVLPTAYVAPEGDLQEAMAALWTEVLGIEPVGVHDNLFELGGDSLVAIQLLSRVKKVYMADIHPSRFFKEPTIAALCRYVSQAAGHVKLEGDPPLVPVAREAATMLSPMQQRLWVVDRLAGSAGRMAYHMCAALEMSGDVDAGIVRKAINAIIARHEVLRTVYVESDSGDPIAVIKSDLALDIAIIDVTGLNSDEAAAQVDTVFDEVSKTPFNLATGPLIRAAFVRLDQRRHVLLLAVHHIVFDGWSIAVFAREFGALYRALKLGETPHLEGLPVQYVDYAFWHHQLLKGASFERGAAFWRDYLNGAPLTSTFAVDSPRSAIASHAGECFRFELERETTEALYALSRQRGTSLFTLLLANFFLILHQSSGLEDVVVGTDVAGRVHPDLENLLGFFVNVVPLRSKRVNGGETFVQWLIHVEKSVLAAMDHQSMPFDRIVDLIGVARSRDRNPLIQVLFVLQNTPDIRFELPGVEVSVRPQEDMHSKFDLAVFVKERDAVLEVDWVFASDLFKRATVERLASSWKDVLMKVVRSPQTPINALVGLNEVEKHGMDSTVSTRAKLGKLTKLVSRKDQPRNPQSPIEISMLATDKAIPVVVKAVGEGLDPVAWAREHRDLIERLLRKHAAILFRKFALETPREFEAFAEAMEPGLYGSYGDLPKKEGGRNTYRSTPYPERQMILYHNESSHLDRWPRKQWFYCELPSRVGGATPIVDGREMLRRLPAELVEQLERKDLLYVRTFVPRLDVSWQDFFKTDSRAEVEMRLAATGISWRWLDEHTLQTRTRGPAVITHPLTGERVFFNQMQLHHVSGLEPEVREDLIALVGSERMPRQVYYGDGAPISDETMAVIGRAYEACAVRFDWRPGDVVMVDNMLAAHARDPYEEPRKIVVAMGDMYDRAMLVAAQPADEMGVET